MEYAEVVCSPYSLRKTVTSTFFSHAVHSSNSLHSHRLVPGSYNSEFGSIAVARPLFHFPENENFPSEFQEKSISLLTATLGEKINKHLVCCYLGKK